MSDLAKRAVACKGWRWMPGMLTLPFHEDNERALAVCHPPWRVTRAGVAGPYADDPTWGALPDLTDPATLGCMLELVREAWGEPSTYAMHDRPEDREPGLPWCINFGDGTLMAGVFRTEAEALVTALEAAEREVS